MSLIHEALEKLDQEKKWKMKIPIPAPPEPLSLKPTLPSKENTRTIYVAIASAVFFFFILGLVYFLANFPRIEKENASTQKVSVSSSPNRPLPVFSSLERQRLFSLTGISRGDKDWTAIVNNQLVRVGDTVNGARVEAIQEQKVVLDFRGQTITLSLYG